MKLKFSSIAEVWSRGSKDAEIYGKTFGVVEECVMKPQCLGEYKP
jgi:hypothetical protein